MQWHKRLGHLNEKDMLLLANKELVKGLTISGSKSLPQCETCLASKAHKTPFPRNTANRASRCGELVHSDIWGPAPVATNSGYRYFASFIDDYSRYTTIYLLRHKSDYGIVFERYCNMVKNKCNRDLTIIHSDNGGEYTSNNIRNYCRSKGIQQRFTVACNSEMNGIAERMNRTLIEMVRCFLHDSKLSKSYWGEAVLYAAYTRNHVPTSAVTDMVPFEAWNNSKPYVSHLHPFGSICYARTVQTAKSSKLDDKAIKCILLGVENETQGYRLLVCGTRQVIISRDVKFLVDSGSLSGTLPDLTVPNDNSSTLSNSLDLELDVLPHEQHITESDDILLPFANDSANNSVNDLVDSSTESSIDSSTDSLNESLSSSYYYPRR
jgi:transposase InsO family protein